MIVEFGTVGNAAYVYRTPMVPVWLRRLRRLPQAPAAFKDTQALKMPPYAFPYEERVVHHTNWVPRTRALLRAWHPLPTDPAPLRW